MATDSLLWLTELPTQISLFLKNMRSETKPGFYRYSYSGDLPDETSQWGLGNTTFALKILFTLDQLTNLPITEKQALVTFINSFNTPTGYIFDPLVAKRAWLIEKLIAIRSWHFNNFWHQQTKRAETRQAISSLRLVGATPIHPFTDFPQSRAEITSYLERLEWIRPWGAASHFSHLIFFLHTSSHPQREELTHYTLDWINKLQHPADGAWYRGHPSLQQKINGAMKVITGFKVSGYAHPHHIEPLIDLCLAARNDSHACDNFNIIYVLAYAHQQRPEYRTSDIKDFAHRRLQIYYDQHYYPRLGGFSFLPHQANQYYYGAKLSRGLAEPDIHGTALFLWGICMIVKLLGREKEFNFKEFLP